MVHTSWGSPHPEMGCTLRFTPGQLRETVGISVETFRHWKRVLPPFAKHGGRAANFSVGDLLAALVLRQLTEDCGVRVGHLLELSKQLVMLCNSEPWAALQGRTLLLDLPTGACRLAQDQREMPVSRLIVLCPLEPVMMDLRDRLMRSRSTSSQQNLWFPLLEVEGKPLARGTAS
jgi:hypothetical protein